MKPRHRKAFTLVELLVVIAIIGVLVALLLPAVQAAREAARRMSCTNNLMQMALAVQNYEGAHRVYPPGTINASGPIVNVAQGYHHNWIAQILPFMEQQVTFEHIDFAVSVYAPRNAPVRNVRIDWLGCPSDPQAFSAEMASSYAGLHHDVHAPIDIDNRGVFFLNSNVSYEDISDGSSHTIFIGEKISDSQNDLGWMSGTRWTLRNTGVALNSQKPGYGRTPTAVDPGAADPLYVGGFGSFHPGGGNFAFGDGHVSYLSETIPAEVYEQLGNRADGKLLPQF